MHNQHPILHNLTQWSKALEPLAETFQHPKIGKPATERELAKIEAELGRPLPTSLRHLVQTLGGSLDFSWFLPEGYELPEPFGELTFGTVELDINGLVEMDESRRDWAEACFSDADDPYNVLWHRSLGFLPVGNGDIIAFDLREDTSDPPVIYLSHDCDEAHGACLGDSFADFMLNWSRLGFVGPECWLLRPFLDGEPGTLNSTEAAARKWQSLFNFPS